MGFDGPVKRRAVVVALAGVSLLAGCAGSAGNDSDHSPAPVDGGATVETVAAWSGLVAEQRSLVEHASLSCEMAPRVVAAQSVAAAMRDAGDATSPSYLGMLPVERQMLVDGTIAAADGVVAVSARATTPAEWTWGIPGCSSPNEHLSTNGFQAFWDLKDALVQWVPYQ